jgi:hypothetical protein
VCVCECVYTHIRSDTTVQCTNLPIYFMCVCGVGFRV